MKPTLLCLLVFLLTGCATKQVQDTGEVQHLKQRIDDLDARVRQLESRYPSDLLSPHRNTSELQAEMARLRKQRQNLLKRYTANHPDVVDLDRRINIIEGQIGH